MKKIFLSFLMLAVLSACKNEEGFTPPAVQTFRQEVYVGEDPVTVRLIDLSGAVAKIEGGSSWLKVENAASVSNSACVKVSVQNFDAQNGGKKDSVTVYGENGNKVNLVVSQSYSMSPPDENSGEYDDFLTDWEHQESVVLKTQTGTINAYLPWAATRQTSLPNEIAEDVKTADGWRMAFCLFNGGTGESFYYFGLDNKFTGTLRVFY
jgi:hypothetical protein